jgi:hypothetical protein
MKGADRVDRNVHGIEEKQNQCSCGSAAQATGESSFFHGSAAHLKA